MMPDLVTPHVKPSPTQLPPVPLNDPFTPAQWKTFLALADTLIPSITPRSTASSKQLGVADAEYSTVLTTIEHVALQGQQNEEGLAKRYLAEVPSSYPAFQAGLLRFAGFYMPQDLTKQLALLLNLLDILFRRTWIASSPTFYNVLSYPRIPVHGVPAKGFEFSFLQIPPGDAPEVIETDVVIVGSGCGAGVCAKNLAEAGYKVIVVEKKVHWESEHLPMSEYEGFEHLWMQYGGIFADDSSIAISAGEAWGGGGTINWSASLQTQGYVRSEWAKQGLPFFTSAEYQHCLDTVCARMGVSADYIEHNKSNDVLLSGARKLGWSAKAVPQNTGGKAHYCGTCTMGCGSCEKQGPVVSFLPDASRAGANFIEGFNVEKIIFKTIHGVKTATGVSGLWTARDEYGGVSLPNRRTRPVIINAKRVVASAGTLQTPLLLKRSGLNNPHIGRHLKLHPVTFIGATFDEEIRPWEGAILTAVVNEFENLDGKGHGTKLEATTMIPSIFLAFIPWKGGLDFKLTAPKLKKMVGHISLARDDGEGRVYQDPNNGIVRVDYTPSKKDKRHILEGAIATAKIQYVEGAREIFTIIPGIPIFTRKDVPAGQEDPGINDPEFQAWLDLVRKTGFPSPDCIFLSAHQMGTSRMAASEKMGVVDSKGKVWGTEGLYVADASVFPSASGVNPMVTNMAISEWISRSLAKSLKGGEAKL
ncbi:long chain fatty alcohol oxidase [Aulographum hederae CBS 113979]|uniref:Long chain fatty alcohol oxidase n=1 Tax=Aulographum hederae CBS 113979 TaxID=1176131 RepID=A0A6G1GL74_9PEZI|nr:long chain fatty alcohol oxidase [Aulographum hederae CBS 113979]